MCIYMYVCVCMYMYVCVYLSCRTCLLATEKGPYYDRAHKLTVLEYTEVYLEFEKKFTEFTFRTRFACSVLVSWTCYSNVNVAFLKFFLCAVCYFKICFKCYALHGVYMARSSVVFL